MLFSAPILTLPNFEYNAPQFVLGTNARCIALGGVLSRRGIGHVIAYVRARLNKN